jgi:hypothetical protein
MILGKGEKPRRGPDVVLIVGRGWELVGERRERKRRRRVRMGDFAIVNMTGFKECAVENSTPERQRKTTEWQEPEE